MSGILAADRREAGRSSNRGNWEYVSGIITADPFRGGVKVLITGPNGLARTVSFPLEELLSRSRRRPLEEQRARRTRSFR